MSLDGGNPKKDEPDLVQKLPDMDAKLSKDRKNRKEKVKPLAKVVIRRLPPTMTEDEFMKQIEPVPDHDYFYFVSADWSLGVNATCRAYINFCNQNDIFIFRDKFDGYVFVDNKGSEYPAIVEFAPFQGLPKSKSRKKDHKANTIETEPHYLAFLESLKDEEADGKTELKMEYSFQLKDDQKITSTPLLEYLANVRQERRDERKRKIEDRKRHREEEKQRKKNQLVKSMPKTIEEDAKENDDGIVVRTIKSRPSDRDRDRDRNRGDKTEKSEGNSRAEREKARNKERQARRKEERERQKKERDGKRTAAPMTPTAGTASANEKNESTEQKDLNRSDGNSDKVKKYSESRRDRKKRNESGQTSKSSKETGKSNDADGNDKMSSDNNKNDRESAEARAQKDRSAITNMRNKDRPSLQIYQPGGKRRTSNSSGGDSHSCENKNRGEYEGDAKVDNNVPSTSASASSSKGHDNRKRNDKKDSSAAVANAASTKGHSEDNSKKSATTATEKRISRYSEKRNKVKEKRDTSDNPATANDCASSSNNKGPTDEMS